MVASNSDAATANTIALGAAGISGVALVLSLYTVVVQRLDKRPKIKVVHSIGLLTYDEGHTSPGMLMLEAQNHGERNITLSSVCLVLPGARQAFATLPSPISGPFPKELVPGDNYTYPWELNAVAVSLRKEGHSGKVELRARYRDKISRKYESKPFAFDIEEWDKDA